MAARSGVSVKTIRFSCDQGLLLPVSRTAGRYRLFDEAVDKDLSLIRTLRALDIPLDTIRTVLEARRSGLCTCENLQATIRAKIGDIQRRIEDLHTLRDDLTSLLEHWQSCGGRSGLVPSHDAAAR
ncbi:MerR family DNA-binding protein [Cyanobium sp. PCC 7001]|uniref:MerR family DNA-binding protein n=1 Tax=Cyanobium sp. PCC 7001 TaxID=180281 RepID=UPI001CEC8961|nr:MerR family DNA-binding protein [Cyanobium sp. PCC 7001]